MDVNVDPADVADMIMTKYSLNMFNEDESVYKLLVEDMNITAQAFATGDVNDGFRPKLMSRLEETVMMNDETMLNNSSLVVAKDKSFAAAEDTRPLLTSTLPPPPLPSSREINNQDILEQRTSPFPVHQQNIRQNCILNAPGNFNFVANDYF